MDALGSGRSDLHGSEIAAWQRFLASKEFYRGRITGDYDYQTKQATTKFQARYGLKPDGIVGPQTVEQARRQGFVVPDGRPHRDHFRLKDATVDLPPGLREVVREVAYHYWLWTGESFTVTSGRRDAYTREEAAGGTSDQVIAAMAAVIAEQERDGVYISRHLLGQAFDVSIRDMSPETEHIAAFMEAVKEVFGSTRDHMPEDWRRAEHLHVQY